MDPLAIGLLCLAALFVLIMLRVAIGVSLLAVSFAGTWIIAGMRPAMGMLGSVPYSTAATWTLTSVPMFLLMGFVAFHAGLTSGLFEAGRRWLGFLPGGLIVASLSGAAGFAAVSGSSIACSAAIGKIALPEMARHRYDLRYSAGALAAGGTIGALIPPSILLIIFGIQSNTAIDKLFLGGLWVGLASLLFYVLTVIAIGLLRRGPFPPPSTGASGIALRACAAFGRCC